MLGQENGQAHYMPATPDALPSTQLPVENLNQAFSGLADEAPALTRREQIAQKFDQFLRLIKPTKRKVAATLAIAGAVAAAACARSVETQQTGPSCPLPTRPSATSTTGETSQTGPTSQTKFESVKSNTSATPTATSTPEATPAPTSTICVGGPEATATPNVEKPRYQTDPSYAAFLFLNQDNLSKLTPQEQADWQAMKANDPYAESNFQKPMFQQTGSKYQELPLQGMILYDNAHLSADKKQIQGYIVFGFHKEVNGTQVPYVVKFKLDSTDPDQNEITNIRGIHADSDWTNGYGGDLAVGDNQKKLDWLQANVDKHVYLGVTRINIPDRPEAGTFLPATLESDKIMKWIQNEGPKPAGILGPDATLDQIAAAPSIAFFCQDAGSF